MKIKIMLVILGLSTLFFLSGCAEEEEKISVTFLQLAKQDNGTFAILVDDANEVYYKMAISSYEYNHWDLEENTVLENLPIQESDANSLSLFSVTVLEIQFNDKWHRMYETDYFEEENEILSK